MKSINLFINSLNGGGAEHQLTLLANFLVNKGYSVTITTISESADHYTLDNRIIRFRIGGQSSARKMFNIWKYFLTLRTDCLISFCQRNSFFALPPLFLRRKIKVICGERNLTIGKSSRIEKILTRFLYKRAQYIVSNNHSQEKHLKEIAPDLSAKLSTIINYTDLNQYKVHATPNNSYTKIGVFARFDAQKNCIRFCDAVATLKRDTESPFEIHWYGNRYSGGKETEIYKNLVERIKSNQLTDCFFLHDPVKDTAPIITEMDAICLPSLYEGFSNSVAEAIACGKPMIVSEVSDNGYMVHEGENGFLFNPLDVEDIAQALVKFIDCNSEKRIAMGVASRKIAETLFNKEQFVNDYIKLIEN